MRSRETAKQMINLETILMNRRLPYCVPGCLVCRPIPSWDRTADLMRRSINSMEHWREHEAERLRRLYPQPSPLQRLVEEVKR